MKKVIHLFAEYSDGEMSECGRGFFANVSFENGSSDIKDVTCKQCISLFNKREPKRIKDLNDYIKRYIALDCPSKQDGICNLPIGTCNQCRREDVL